MTSHKGLAMIKFVKQFLYESNGFDKILEKIKLVSAGNGGCVAEFTVQPQHLNGGGGLHGGFTATLVDSISTYALMTNEGPNQSPGVSVDIHVSYIKGAKEGDQIIVNAQTVKAGKTLAFLEVEMKNKLTNVIIAKGSHTKYVGK